MTARLVEGESLHLMAGGGGDRLGFALAGWNARQAMNHLPSARDTVLANDPSVDFHLENVGSFDWSQLEHRPPQVIVGSPVCEESSFARNGGMSGKAKPLEQHGRMPKTRTTALAITEAASVLRPDVVIGENVPEFVFTWRLFDWWRSGFEHLGMTFGMTSVNAAHVSGPGNQAVHQSRDRMIFWAVRKGLPKPDMELRPEAVCPNCGPVCGVRFWKTPVGQASQVGWYERPDQHLVGFRGARAYYYLCPQSRCGQRVEPVVQPIRPHLDLTKPMRTISEGRDSKGTPYAQNTRGRIAGGIAKFGPGSWFIVVCRNHGQAWSLDGPVPTFSAQGNHHMLCHAGETVDSTRIRMLDSRDKKLAQRFPESYRLVAATETERGLLASQAVPVNVAQWMGTQLRSALYPGEARGGDCGVKLAVEGSAASTFTANEGR